MYTSDTGGAAQSPGVSIRNRLIKASIVAAHEGKRAANLKTLSRAERFAATSL